MNQKVTFAHSPFCPSFPSFPVQKLTETKTSVKKLEFLSFSPIWADANKYMCVTSTEVFLLLFLGNYKWTEKGGILVRSFTHHLYSNQLVKHSSLILSLFYDSVEKWTVCPWVMKWRSCWEVTRSSKTQKFSLSLEFRFDKPSYQFGYLISRFLLWTREGTQQKG